MEILSGILYGLSIFLSYYLVSIEVHQYYSCKRLIKIILERKRNIMRKALRKSKHFDAMPDIFELAHLAEKIVSLGNQSGEGWLLTAEMVELIEGGVGNILCVQPFACLPNHVTGKGMIKELRRRFPSANISAIDYDPGSSEVNQLNRLKLLLSNAPVGNHPDETKDGMIRAADGSLVKPEIRRAEGATDVDPAAEA